MTEFPRRLFYVDHLRALLASLAVLHHTAITHGGGGWWFHTDGLVTVASQRAIAEG